MRISFTYILLFCYIFAVFRPITPAVQDFIAHALYESQHLAEIHYENGSYHVHKELADVAESNDKRPVSEDSQLQVKESVSYHLITTAILVFNKELELLTYRETASELVTNYIKLSNPPPELNCI